MILDNDSYPPELVLDGRSRSQAKEDWESHRQEAESEEEEVPAYYQRKSAGVWTCLAVLAVALGIVMAYGYSIVRQEDIQVAQIPGLTRSLPAISQHVESLENRLAASRVDQKNLALRVQSIDAESKAALGQTKEQTGRLVAQLQRTLSVQASQQAAAIQAQLAKLASDRSAERLRLTQVEGQLADERNQLETARAAYAQELATLREQQGADHRELASISSTLPTHQVTFDILKNQPIEIAPGVTFQLTKADVNHQRFDGWIQASSGHQRVSVQGQGVRTPVMFYPSEDSKAVVMVVTRINAAGAAGYVLIPAAAGTTDQAHLASAADNSASPAAAPSVKSGVAEQP